jgi:hypothetical protein
MKAIEVLDQHEIVRVDLHASGPGGYWVPVANCKCGYTSPPEKRAYHLAKMLEEAGVCQS